VDGVKGRERGAVWKVGRRRRQNRKQELRNKQANSFNGKEKANREHSDTHQSEEITMTRRGEERRERERERERGKGRAEGEGGGESSVGRRQH
jgi:hypothetical protein